MAVVKLDTGGVALPSASKGSSNTGAIVIGVLLTAGIGYLAYKHLWIPYKTKKDAEKAKAIKK